MTAKKTGIGYLAHTLIFLLLMFTTGCKITGSLECRYEERETGIQTVGKVGFENG